MGKLGIEPSNGVSLGEEGLERLGTAILSLLLRVDAVQLRAPVGPVREGAEVDIRRPGVGQRRDPQLPEEVDAVGRRGHPHQHKIVLREARELVVREVARHGERLGIVLCDERRLISLARVPPVRFPRSNNCLLDAGEREREREREKTRQWKRERTVVLVAEMHEILLQLMLDLFEDVDGFVLGRVRGPELDCLFSSLAGEEASCQLKLPTRVWKRIGPSHHSPFWAAEERIDRDFDRDTVGLL